MNKAVVLALLKATVMGKVYKTIKDGPTFEIVYDNNLGALKFIAKV